MTMILLSSCTCTLQVYLVTGGSTNNTFTGFLSSTELLTRGQAQWVEAAPLPGPVISALGGVSINNLVFVTGKENPL